MTTHPLAVAKKYYSFSRSRIFTLKEYAFDFLGGILLLPIQLLVTFLVWKVIYTHVGELGKFNLEEMIVYQLLVQNLAMAVGQVYILNYRVWEDIHHGKLSIYLARPVNYQMALLANEVGECGIKIVIRSALFLIGCIVLQLPIQTDPGILASFLGSLVFAFQIGFFIQFIIGSMTFWTEKIFGVRDIIATANQLLSGMLIPISILPEIVRKVSSVLPFQFTLFIPASIYLGHFEKAAFLKTFSLQILWVFILLAISKIIFKRGLAKYTAQGG